jgi:hypothetical protein
VIFLVFSNGYPGKKWADKPEAAKIQQNSREQLVKTDLSKIIK